MKAYLGNYVKTKKHSYRGRVYAKHYSAKDTKENESWFELQKPPVTEEEKKESWYSILCYNEGAVLVSERDIIEIEEPYPLKNVWEDEYFEKCAE